MKKTYITRLVSETTSVFNEPVRSICASVLLMSARLIRCSLLGERARYIVDEHDTAEAAFAYGRVALVGAFDERHFVVHEQPFDIDALEFRSFARQAEVQAIARIVSDDDQHARLIRATNKSNLCRRFFFCCMLTK